VRTSNTASPAPDSGTSATAQSPAPANNHIDLGLGWRILIAVVSIVLGCILLARMIARRRRRPPS
jgi:hypothetical protein